MLTRNLWPNISHWVIVVYRWYIKIVSNLFSIIGNQPNIVLACWVLLRVSWHGTERKKDQGRASHQPSIKNDYCSNGLLLVIASNWPLWGPILKQTHDRKTIRSSLAIRKIGLVICLKKTVPQKCIFSNKVVTRGVWESTFHFSDTHKKKKLYDTTQTILYGIPNYICFFQTCHWHPIDIPVPMTESVGSSGHLRVGAPPKSWAQRWRWFAQDVSCFFDQQKGGLKMVNVRI